MTTPKYFAAAASIVTLFFAGVAYAGTNDMRLDVNSHGDGNLQGVITSISGTTLGLSSWAGTWTVDASDADFTPVSTVSQYLTDHSTSGYVSDLDNGDIHVGDATHLKGVFTTSGLSGTVDKQIEDNSLRLREQAVKTFTGVVSNPNASAGTFTLTVPPNVLTGASAISYSISVPTTAHILVAGVQSPLSSFFANLSVGATATAIGAPSGTSVTALLVSVGTYNRHGALPPATSHAKTTTADTSNELMVNINTKGQGSIQGFVGSISGTTLGVNSWGGTWAVDTSGTELNASAVSQYLSQHSTSGYVSPLQNSDIHVGDTIRIDGVFSDTSLSVIADKHSSDNSLREREQAVKTFTGVVSNPNASAGTFTLTVPPNVLTGASAISYAVTMTADTIALVTGVKSSESAYFANLPAGSTATAIGAAAGTNVSALLVSVGTYNSGQAGNPPHGNQTTAASQATVSAATASCSFNGQTIDDGSSVTAYDATMVSDSGQCISELRTCSNGTLSGSYGSASCSVVSSTNSDQTTTTGTINSLLAQINTLQASIAALQNGGSTQTTQATYVSSGGTCPILTRFLSRGSRGADVVLLQQYLIAQGDLAAGNDTGYFGPLTEAAVQQWQAAHGDRLFRHSRHDRVWRGGPQELALRSCGAVNPHRKFRTQSPYVTMVSCGDFHLG